MIFLFKKSKFVLDCFTSEKYIYDNNKINYARKFFPEWWKDTPKYTRINFTDSGTIKKCNGVIDLYRTGAMIPLWADLSMDVHDGVCQYQFADYSTETTQHNPQQWHTYADPSRFVHIKIASPWKCKTKLPIKFHFTFPAWSHSLEAPYTVLSGIVDYKYQHATNINLMVDTTKQGNLVIHQSTPMAHIIPITDKELVIKNHLVDAKEIRDFSGSFTFSNFYKINKKRIDEEEKSKCPFGFLKGDK